MKLLFRLYLGFILSIGNAVSIAAKLQPIEPESKVSPALQAFEAGWTFSGMVLNEDGEQYSYYFNMQHRGPQFHAEVTLIDGQNKLILFEESEARLESSMGPRWQVGPTFLQFNPINNSWIFGIKTQEKKGFNFKVDMLDSAENASAQKLRPGLSFLISQTGHLNGHLQTSKRGKEQFVMASKTWFKQIWTSTLQQAAHPLTGLLCQFNDGSGFYALNLREADALKGAVAGWRTPQGEACAVSQFVSFKEVKEGLWNVNIPSPKRRFSLQNALNNKTGHLIAGRTEGKTPGFCLISKEEVGKLG